VPVLVTVIVVPWAQIVTSLYLLILIKLGRLPQDEAIVFEARAVAEDMLDDDPDLVRNEQLREEVTDLLGDAVEFLFKS